jgi:predicted enzyme related to lactoylglutathione lyase
MSTTAKISTLTIDCADPRSLAQFYAPLLGTPIDQSSADYVTLAGGAVQLAFQRIDGYKAPAWPDEQKHTHLDLTVPDLDAAVEALLASGATRPEFQPGDGDWIVLADPEGHVFCVMAEG